MHADFEFWQNSSGGVFQSGSNWDDGIVPGSDDWAIFTQANNGTISWSGSATVYQTEVDAPFSPYTAGGVGRAHFNLNGHTLNTSSLKIGSYDVTWSDGDRWYASSGELHVTNGAINVGAGFGSTRIDGNSKLQIHSGGQVTGGTVFVGSINDLANYSSSISVSGPNSLLDVSGISGGGGSTTTSISVSDNAILKVRGGVGLLSGSSISLSNGVLDAAYFYGSDAISVDGHGILIGNSHGLTVAAPNGAVDYSRGLNIGSRRADIFSNDTATLRGDVSLANGGALNSNQTLQMVGNEFTQTGGATTVGGQFAIDNAVARISGGTWDVSQEIQVGRPGGSSSLIQSGGDITSGSHVSIGSGALGVYNISGGTLTTTGGGELIVGETSVSNGIVTQTGGTVNVNELTLANLAGAEASYDLQAGTINTRNRVHVGWNDAATFTQSGGDVNVAGQFLVNHGSTATINDGTINAVDSIRVGVTAGTSSSMIQNSGLVKTDEYFVIGSNGSGSYELTGGTIEAKGIDRGLAVGSTGASVSASMAQSGGLVDVGELVVGHTSGGTNTYTLSNGRIDARDRIVVGNHVVGTFTQTGGHVDSLNATIIVGNTQGADGSHYQVDGGLTETSSLWVGNFGDATFTQTAGYVDASGVAIAREATSTASYSLQGGRLWSSGTVYFGHGNGSFELDGGILDVNTLDATGGSFTFNSGELQADTILGLDLNMSDGLLNVGTLNGDLNMMGGTLAPGNSPGMTTINGDYLLTGGLLDMELAGLTQGTGYDFLDINGNWTITGGDLQISLLGGFMPMAGNSFDLFDFNSLTGMFDNVFLPTLGSGLSWNTSSLYTTGVLSVNNTAAVPEPSTFGLLAIGSLSCIVLRRRRSGLAKQV